MNDAATSAVVVNPHAPLRVEDDDITITTPQLSSLLSHLLTTTSRNPLSHLSLAHVPPDPPTSDTLAQGLVQHVPLSRCTTAPAFQSFADVLAANANARYETYGERE